MRWKKSPPTGAIPARILDASLEVRYLKAEITSLMKTNANPAFSIPSIIAIIAAILSFTTGAFLGLVLAIAAIVFGAIGVMLSLSPSVRGGFVSILGVVAGLIGIIAAVVKVFV